MMLKNIFGRIGIGFICLFIVGALAFIGFVIYQALGGYWWIAPLALVLSYFVGAAVEGFLE